MIELVVGAGEVGTAVAKVLGCDVVDVWLQPRSVDHLHVCFPHTDDFAAEVRRYRDLFTPGLIVVHSTVPVGTCQRLGVIHSPVRGRHPHLAESLCAFVKFFAGPDAARAASRWPGPVEVVPDPATTEAAKLWELVQFGLQVAIQKDIYAWCETAGTDPEIVYRRFAETYNAGYTALGEPRFVRPVIEPTPGSIGGHCVIQNAPLLDHRLARLLVDMDAGR